MPAVNDSTTECCGNTAKGFDMRMPVIIDVESSGFGKGGYPIEVGLVLPDGSPHCFLVTPERTWTAWDDEAEAVHGISREVLDRHGRPAREVAERLNALLREKTVYSDAWSFDMSWLAKLYDAVDLEQGFQVAALHDIMSTHQLEQWHAVKNQVARDLQLQRHRASGDARILQETYRRTLDQVA